MTTLEQFAADARSDWPPQYEWDQITTGHREAFGWLEENVGGSYSLFYLGQEFFHAEMTARLGR